MLKLVFWTLAAISFPLALVVGVWMSTSSGFFIRVHDMTYDPAAEVITMNRSVLSRDDVLARWYMVVQLPLGQRLPDGRSECSDSGVDIYEPRYIDGTEKSSASFPAGPLAPCLNVPDSQIVASWQVLYWGFFPLKPTYFFQPPRT